MEIGDGEIHERRQPSRLGPPQPERRWATPGAHVPVFVVPRHVVARNAGETRRPEPDAPPPLGRGPVPALEIAHAANREV